MSGVKPKRRQNGAGPYVACFKISPEALQGLDEMAQDEGRNRSGMIRFMIQHYLLCPTLRDSKEETKEKKNGQ